MGVGSQPHGATATTPGKDPVLILQETGWAPGPVWAGGKSRPPRDFFLNCVFIGTYTLQSQQVDSYSLLVSLCHTLHSVTASRGESLRGWEVFAVQRCTVPYYHLLVRL